MPYLRPSDILKTLLREDPWLLLGGLDPGQDAHALLRSFWRTYRIQQPTHKIFEMADRNEIDLDWTVPMMMHGDGARTVKKQPLEVVSLIAVLGTQYKARFGMQVSPAVLLLQRFFHPGSHAAKAEQLSQFLSPSLSAILLSVQEVQRNTRPPQGHASPGVARNCNMLSSRCYSSRT